MDEVCLSKENMVRLKDLGFGEVAAVVLLPHVRLEAATLGLRDMSISAQMTLVEAVEAAKNLPQESSDETRLDILLQIFAGLILLPATAKGSFGGADIDIHDIDTIPIEMGQSDRLDSSANRSDLLLYDDLTLTLTSHVLRDRGTADKQCVALQAEAALASLVVLLHRLQNSRLPTSTLVVITAYTDPNDLWTTKTAARLARRILSLQLPGKDLVDFITGPVLNQHVRLTLSSPTGGDPSAFSTGFGSVATSNSEEYENAAAVLNWAIGMTERADIGKHWHLFVPALVHLVDSHEISVKERGLKAMILFLAKCPSSAIYATGMDQLFERTIMPTLLLLPTVTPEKDSVTLLRLGYTAALQLATTSGYSNDANRRRLLDAIVRDGIIAGFRHAADYIFVVDVLMQYLAKAVSGLGIFSIKHLTDLLDVIESVMCDPFGADHHPGVLTSATDALLAIITNCWPRISNTKRVEQILRVLSVCWLHMGNEASQSDPERSIQDVKSRILQVAGSVRFFVQANESEINGASRAAVSRNRQLQGILMQ